MTLHRGPLLLASQSPRRRALLEAAGFTVAVRVPADDEAWPGGSVESGVVALAERKLARVGAFTGLGVAADTVVVVDGRRLGKPGDATEAREMLALLAGREHRVVTGFCVAHHDRRAGAAVVTRVWFRRLVDAEIERYVASAEPYDKAGGYAIQGRAGAFVERLEGSYTNVVGLPLSELLAAMEALT